MRNVAPLMLPPLVYMCPVQNMQKSYSLRLLQLFDIPIQLSVPVGPGYYLGY